MRGQTLLRVGEHSVLRTEHPKCRVDRHTPVSAGLLSGPNQEDKVLGKTHGKAHRKDRRTVVHLLGPVALHRGLRRF